MQISFFLKQKAAYELRISDWSSDVCSSDLYGEDAYTRGLTVVTTGDSRKQRAATTALRKALLAYDERHGWRGPEAKLPAAALTDAGHDNLAHAFDGRPTVAELRAAAGVSYQPDQLVLLTPDGPLTLQKEASAWDKRGEKPPETG